MPAPTFSKVSGTYSAPITVTISEAASCATVYYTTDGTTPTTSSSVFHTPLSISKTTVLQAIAVCDGGSASAVSSAAYTISALSAPTFSVATGTYSAPFSVIINEATACATVYYTTDGSTPTTASAVYTSPVSISNTTTLQAMAVCAGESASAVSSATYTISAQNPPVLSPPTLSFATGTYFAPFSVIINEPASCATVYYTTDGTAPTNASTVYNSPIAISKTTNLQAIAICPGETASAVSSATYTFSALSPPVFSLKSGTYAAPITITISDAVSCATVFYTMDGTTPTALSTAYSSPITVSTTTTLRAIAACPGGSTSAVASVTYRFSGLEDPSFSKGPGTYYAPISVAISDTSACATVYYTTDGSKPTTSSAVYGNPISVSRTTTLRAIAYCSAENQSAVVSATYAISAPDPPYFNEGSGTYAAPLEVSISDATSCATIYYTTNGDTPTTRSKVYSSSISISKTARFRAIAACPGGSSSAVSAVSYTVSGLVGPSFSKGSGTYYAPIEVAISDDSACAVYYTTDGTKPTTSSTLYSSPVSIPKTTTIQAMAACSADNRSAVASAAYAISAPSAPSFSAASGTYSSPLSVKISDAASCASVYYTTDGSTPTTASAVYGSSISISKTTTLMAIAACPGGSSSSVASAAYNMGGVAMPVLSMPSGTYNNSIKVSISEATSGATVYYTTDGSTPTKSSSVYQGALTFSNSGSSSTTTTLKAIAAASGSSTSSAASATYTIVSASSPTTSSGSTAFFGMDVNGLTYGTPWPAVPVGTLRLWDSNTPWVTLNPSSGTYSWTYLDENIKLAQANGAQIIYTFGRTPSWATANGASCTGNYAPNGCEEPPVLADWDAFVTAIVNHVGPGVIKYWEMWNEANLTGEYWNGTDAQLVQMAVDARQIIKAADPNAIILSPSETDNYTGSTACLTTNRCGSAWLQGWLAAGGAAAVDGVAFHAYPQINEAPEQVVAQVAAQRAVMSANGLGSAPLLDTESGWGQNSDLPATADQVAFLARHMILMQSSGVTTAVWYAYDGGTWGPLWTSSSGLNEPGVAYGQVAAWLTGASLATACAPTAASATVYTCEYSRSSPSGYSALAVWSTNGNTTFTVPAGYTQYRDLAGNVTAISGTTVPLTEAPILLETTSAF